MRIEGLMNCHYAAFSENDKLICRFILEHRDQCQELSIEEFAACCHVSKTTLFRFAKKLSLSGFAELKARLKWEGREKRFRRTDFMVEVVDSYHQLVEDLQKKDCRQIFTKMKAARGILAFGSGYAQGRVASEFKRIFLPLGLTIYQTHGYDMSESLINMAGPEDYVIIFSLSGESPAVISLAEALRAKGISALSITRMDNNTLATLCDDNLYIQTVDLQQNYDIPYEISTPYFILIEMLFLKYQAYLVELETGHNSKN